MVFTLAHRCIEQQLTQKLPVNSIRAATAFRVFIHEISRFLFLHLQYKQKHNHNKIKKKTNKQTHKQLGNIHFIPMAFVFQIEKKRHISRKKYKKTIKPTIKKKKF